MNTPSLCLLGALLLGCTAPEEGPAPPPEVPEPPWPALQDLNQDPAIVEVALTAMEADLTILSGTMTPVWAYRDASSGCAAHGTRAHDRGARR